MHHTRRKKALQLIGDEKDPVIITEKLQAENFTADEIVEVIAIVDGSAVQSNPGSNDKQSDSGKIDLSEFDYKNLTGESFDKYARYVGDPSYTEIVEGRDVPVPGTLRGDDMYDFVLMKAKPVMVERFPGMKDSPFDYKGIRVINDTPIHKTRIPVNVAHEYNRQILNAHSRAGHGKYYFLAKD
jgi:hypothetical protein